MNREASDRPPSNEEVLRLLERLEQDPEQFEESGGWPDQEVQALFDRVDPALDDPAFPKGEPAPIPSDRLRARFYRFLAEYEHRSRRRSLRTRIEEVLGRLWPQTPGLQAAVALAALLIGVALGASVLQRTSGRQIDQLRAELDAAEQRFAEALLSSPSPSERLRAVSLSGASIERQSTVDRLLEVVSYDTSENVRLAALDVLARLIDRPQVQTGLADALPRQRSPMLQVALGDLLARGSPEVAVPAFERLLEANGLEPPVRQRIEELLADDSL